MLRIILYSEVKSQIMGRRPHHGGIERMTFSFSRAVARRIRKMADRKGHSYTHFVSMACMQYFRMKTNGAWMCQGSPYAVGCTHLTSRTTDKCEVCGELSYEARAKRDRAAATKRLEEGPGKVIPIKDGVVLDE